MKLERTQLFTSASKSCHRCSLAAFVTGPWFYQDTGREATGRDRGTALSCLTILYVFWCFKDTTEPSGVTWLILSLWNRAQRVTDFKVSLFNLALQSADAELQFSNRGGGVACFPDYLLLRLLINQAQACYNDWLKNNHTSFFCGRRVGEM